jgi:hypothetical protein
MPISVTLRSGASAHGGALLVGGFARATRLRQADLLPDPGRGRRPGRGEADILAHVNEDHADAVAAIAQGCLGEGSGAWRWWRWMRTGWTSRSGSASGASTGTLPWHRPRDSVPD